MKIIAKNFEGVNGKENVDQLVLLLELIKNNNYWYEVVDGEQVLILINQNHHAEKRFNHLVNEFNKDLEENDLNDINKVVKRFCSQHTEWVITWLQDRIKTEKMWYQLTNK